MTLYQFKALAEKEQAEAVWSQGVHLSEREDQTYKVLLYQIEAFYVEVYYHKELNAIGFFRSFDTIEKLTPYLSQIKIDL